MNKVVVTDSFFNNYLTSSSPSFTNDCSQKQTTQTQKIAKFLNRRESEILQMSKIEHAIVSSVFVKNAEENIKKKLSFNLDKFGKSVHQVLQEFFPNKCSTKNSNLSNFDFEKTCNKFPSVKSKFQFMMNRSCSEQLVNNKKVDALIMKNQINLNTNKLLEKKRKMIFITQKEEYQREINTRPECFDSMNNQFLMASGKIQDRRSKITDYNIVVPKNVQNKTIMNKLSEYQRYWNMGSDLSIKKKVILKNLKNDETLKKD